MWCIQRNQSLRSSGITYKVHSCIRIEGLDAYDYYGNKTNNRQNAKLAYILTQAQRNGVYGSRLYSNHNTVIDSPATNPPKVYIADDENTAVVWGQEQNAIWRYINSWMDTTYGRLAGMEPGLVEADNPVGGETNLEIEGNRYAEGFNGTNDENILNNRPGPKNVSLINNGQTIEIGPFNFSFPGTEGGILISQDGNTFIGVSHNNPTVPIPSGGDFYIHIPASSGINQIKKIKIRSHKEGIKAVNIYFYYTTEAWQNVIETETNDDIQKWYEGTFDFDIKLTGDLTINKVDAADSSIKLDGVGFKIKNEQLGYVKQNSNGVITYVGNNINDATTFITNANGQIIIKKLITGVYNIKEVSNKHYGYEANSQGTNITIKSGNNNQTIKNVQKYVQLSGYVWNDMYSGGKVENRNNIYDVNDKKLSGITVALKNSSGNTIKTTITSNEGSYIFKDVLIEELDKYVVEFKYDGLIYQNVIPYMELSNTLKPANDITSKASEDVTNKTTNRDNFNKEFDKIENYNGNTGTRVSKDEKRNNDLNYNKNTTSYTSELNHKSSKFNITSDTGKTKYNLKNAFKAGQENITNINLGIYEREQPDLAIIKDVENVKVSINGYSHTYNYGNRFENEKIPAYTDGLDIKLKFANKRGKESYTRELYPSDIKETDINQKEVKVKYRIQVINESTTLNAKINKIFDYYDNRYTVSKVGTSIKDGEIKNEIKNIKTNQKYNSTYGKTEIDLGTLIQPNEKINIYVELTISGSEMEKILTTSTKNITLDNVVEIGSYSIQKNGSIYAGIDKDSAPGNAIPGDISTYEDDTDRAPSFILSIKQNKERQISGIAFVDKIIESGEGKVRQGNGIYENGESGINKVKVELKEEKTGKVFTTNTTNNGKYNITGFIPGTYIMTYIWGDDTYAVQEYKSTITPSSEWIRKTNDALWYKTQIPRYSDALDEYTERTKIDNEIIKVENGEAQRYETKQISAKTPKIQFNVEYDDTDKAGKITNEKEIVPYTINNIDFGIVERAKQQIVLNKYISHVELLLANGQEIANITIDEKGNTTGNNEYFTYIPKSGIRNGMGKIEIDNELIQGAILNIEYTLNVENKSELDYKDKNFYNYGTKGIYNKDTIIKMQATGIYDWLDEEISIKNDKTNEWDKVKLETYNNTYNTEPTLEERKETKITKDVNGNIIITTTIDGKVFNGITYKVWKEKLIESRKQALVDKIILKETANTLGSKIAPTEKIEKKIYTSKVLSSKDEIEIENEAEITKVKKDGGSSLIQKESKFHDKAEDIIVIPPTGQKNKYIYIIIGIISLIILVTGVIIIKKKTLKTKDNKKEK